MKIQLTRLLVAIPMLILGALACARGRQIPTPSLALTPPAGDLSRSLDFDGDERSYILHIPPKLDATRALPLVIVFHGGGGNAQNAIRMTDFNALADEDEFLVIYPNGSGRLEDKILTWNGGNCCGYAQEQNVDDVGFVRAVLKDVQSIVSVDAKRIYAAGMSNGGIMSYRLACEMSDVFAAIGPVAGTLNFDECDPSEPVSVIHFHGTDDQHLPYTGGVGEDSLVGVVFAPVIDSVTFWVDHNSCGPNPYATKNSDVRRLEFGPCTGNTAVELYSIQGGKHAWPGSDGPGWLGGDIPTTEPDATRVMWEFFKAHPKQ